jgi:hypothetical protein
MAIETKAKTKANLILGQPNPGCRCLIAPIVIDKKTAASTFRKESAFRKSCQLLDIGSRIAMGIQLLSALKHPATIVWQGNNCGSN